MLFDYDNIYALYDRYRWKKLCTIIIKIFFLNQLNIEIISNKQCY